MKSPCISEVRAYWEALRDGRAAPYRSEVDPRGIERCLENSFILERIAPQVARFRLAGMHLVDVMGMEVRGMPFTAFFTPKARAEVSVILETVFAGPKTAEITIEAEQALGKPALAGGVLLLPLRSDLGDVNRVLGCLVTEGPIGRPPRRFDVRESLTSPIPQRAPNAPHRFPAHSAPVTGLAESPTPFSGPKPHTIRSRGHLRLVVSHK